MTPATPLSPPPLPDRVPEIVDGLPHPFARAQIDSCTPSFALTSGGAVVSTDAWSGRQLAKPTSAGWEPVTAGRAWHRRPRWAGDELICDVHTDPIDEHSTSRSIAAAGSPIDQPCPFKVTRTARLVRRGASGSVVCEDGGSETVLEHVVEIGPWVSRDELLVIKENWPSRELYRWHLGTGRLDAVFETGRRVVTDVHRSGELVGLSRTSTGQPRRLELLERGELRRTVHRVEDDPTDGPRPGPVRALCVDGPVCGLPCLHYEPRGRPRGTIVLLHGGPHGVNLATWSPLADSLVLAGWRLVLPNIRGSGVLDPRLRPPRPDRYGEDDVDDVLAVIRHFAVGKVVVGGRSYGGYLAARTAMASPEVAAVFLLGGFLASTDLRDTRHPAVTAFLRAAGTRFAPDRRPAPVPHFLAHGGRDDRIPVDAVLAHADDLPDGSEVVTLADEGHGVRTDPGARQAFPALFRWLDGLG